RTVDVAGERYLASIAPLDELESQGGDFILNAAPSAAFEGSLATAAERSVVLGLLVVLLVSPVIFYLARLVSQPLDQLANNAKLIEAILETVPNPLFYKGPDGRYTGCNGAYETYFGVERANLVGKHIGDVAHISEADRLALQGMQEAIIRVGGAMRREMELELADGRHRETLYQLTGFRRSDGSPGG